MMQVAGSSEADIFTQLLRTLSDPKKAEENIKELRDLEGRIALSSEKIRVERAALVEEEQHLQLARAELAEEEEKLQDAQRRLEEDRRTLKQLEKRLTEEKARLEEDTVTLREERTQLEAAVLHTRDMKEELQRRLEDAEAAAQNAQAEEERFKSKVRRLKLVMEEK